MAEGCVFCEIRDNETEALVVLDEPSILAFLDIRPLFPGHVLVVPKAHCETLMDLPEAEVGTLFGAVQRLSVAIKETMGSDGILVVSNNGVSQSVAHLHVHVVPRNKKDGLRGFMWPRHKYQDGEAARIAEMMREAF